MIQLPRRPRHFYRGLFFGTWNERKRLRIDYYKTYIEGWKLRPCLACNGSGHYDSFGSPRCGACEGTGKEWYKPEMSRVC